MKKLDSEMLNKLVKITANKCCLYAFDFFLKKKNRKSKSVLLIIFVESFKISISNRWLLVVLLDTDENAYKIN